MSQLQNLGQMGGDRAYRSLICVRLTGNETGREFLPEHHRGGSRSDQRVPAVVTSRILETDANGNEVSERIVFKGQGVLECGD